MKKHKIVLISGGTGGHVIPAVNLGNYIVESGINKVFLYGDLMKSLYEKSKDAAGFSVEHFSTQELLIKNLNNFICKNDVIYIKGSRGMKMEKIIKGLK